MYLFFFFFALSNSPDLYSFCAVLKITCTLSIRMSIAGRVSYNEAKEAVCSGNGSGSETNAGSGAGVAAGGRAFACFEDTVSLQPASDRIPTAAIAAQPAWRTCRTKLTTTLSFMVFVHPCDARYLSAGFYEAA